MIKRAFCIPKCLVHLGASGTFSLPLLASAIGTALAIGAVGSAAAEETPVFDGELSDINNAYPVVRFEFSSQQLAHKTRALLYERGGKTVIVRGHSIGGMLATRFALMCPYQTEQLVLVNSIGLEDWKALGVPYQSIDEG